MTKTEYRNKVIDAVMYIHECFREEAVEMVSRMEHIIDNNYACDSQVYPLLKMTFTIPQGKSFIILKEVLC